MNVVPFSQWVKLSRAFGRDPLLVQGGGGNISTKLTGDTLLIKASGARLREVDRRHGWAQVDLKAFRRGARQLRPVRPALQREARYAALLDRTTRRHVGRPSMETGFHALLPDLWVAHVHSVVGVLLGWMSVAESRAWVRRIFGGTVDLRRVPYRIPGFDLGAAMMDRYRTGGAGTTLWLQQNHGVTWTAESPAIVRARSGQLEFALRKHFRVDRFPFPRLQRGAPAAMRRWPFQADVVFDWPNWRLSLQPLLPDFVIYFDLWDGREPDLTVLSPGRVRLGAGSAANFRDKLEVLFAQALLSTLGPRVGRLRGLSSAAIRTLKNLETERRRLQQMKSS